MEVDRYSFSDEIRTAYRNLSKKWHPDLNPGQDVTQKMQDINEAYAILKDSDKKARYDYEYDNYYCSRRTTYSTYEEATNQKNQDYEVQDEHLKQDIQEARRYAADLVREFMERLKKTSKNAAKGAWSEAKGYIIAGIIISIIGTCIATCNHHKADDFSPSTNTLSSQQAPSSPPPIILPIPQPTELSGFSTQSFYNSFSISLPATVERRRFDSPYSRNLRQNGIMDIAPDVIVFNQKGLGNMSETAQKQYCRIMILYTQTQAGDFLQKYETAEFDLEARQVINELVIVEIGELSNLMGNISYDWIRVNNANGVLIEYKRSGAHHDTTIPVCCKMILFQNNDKFVKMILSYREAEAYLWKDDFDVVLRSFKWL